MYRFSLNMYRFMGLKLLTIGQAAEIIGVSVQTLRRWDDSGKLSSIRKKATGHRYYSRKDIELYLKNNVKPYHLLILYAIHIISNLQSLLFDPNLSLFHYF